MRQAKLPSTGRSAAMKRSPSKLSEAPNTAFSMTAKVVRDMASVISTSAPSPRRAPFLRLRLRAADEMGNERQNILIAKGRRDGAPLPFPFRAFREEQRLALDRPAQRLARDVVAAKSVGARDQQLLDQLGTRRHNACAEGAAKAASAEKKSVR